MKDVEAKNLISSTPRFIKICKIDHKKGHWLVYYAAMS